MDIREDFLFQELDVLRGVVGEVPDHVGPKTRLPPDNRISLDICLAKIFGKQKPTVYDIEDHDLGLALWLLSAPVIRGSFSLLVLEYSVHLQFVNFESMQI